MPSSAADKKRYLAWWGFRDENGVRRDDLGNEIRKVVGTPARPFIGDIKPTPILLPATFDFLSHVRSRWIDLGRVDRRAVPANVPGVRSIIEQGTAGGDPFTNLLAGPTFLFAATSTEVTREGWVDYVETAGGISIPYPPVAGSEAAVSSLESSTFRGRVAYRLKLAATNAVLAAAPGRYTGYKAVLTGAGNVWLGEFTVLGHDGDTLHLDADNGALPGQTVTDVVLLAKFFQVETNGQPGLGPFTTENNRRVPLSNVRIGFAFSSDPKNASARFPASGFLYDLNVGDPDLLRQIRSGKHRFAQYDILFNTSYSESAPDNVDRTRRLTPALPRPMLKELILPFQF